MGIEFDLLIVGAGPAGTSCAIKALEMGVERVMVVEKGDKVRGKPCGGGLSPRALSLLDILGIGDEVRKIGYTIRGLRLVSPKGREVFLGGKDCALILKREDFHKVLTEKAEKHGAFFSFGKKVIRIQEKDDWVEVEIENGGDIHRMRSSFVVVAAGANQRLVKKSGATKVVHACMAWFSNIQFTAHVVEMIYHKELLPHYAWLFPIGGGTANIGLCIGAEERLKLGKKIPILFQDIFSRYFAERGGNQIDHLMVHPIYVSKSVNTGSKGRILIIGEAGGIVNPATGEGISYALESGMMAAKAVHMGLMGGLKIDEVSKWYEASLKNRLDRTLWFSHLFLEYAGSIIEFFTSLSAFPPIRLALTKFLRDEATG